MCAARSSLIGLSTSLINRDHHEVYFEGTPTGPRGEVLRRHGDQMELLDGGYLRCQGRADDTMNLGGIKVSSAEIERAVSRVDGLVETAAIAYDPPGGGPKHDRRPRTYHIRLSRRIYSPLFQGHDLIPL